MSRNDKFETSYRWDLSMQFVHGNLDM